jgi:hypothetical protein
MSQNEPGGKLKARQQAAVGAILSSRTLAEASANSGVSTATLKRWQAQPAFREALEQGSRDLLSSAITHMLRASSRAAETLVSLLESEQEGIRLRAALGLFDRVTEMVAYLDLEARLQSVEEQLKHRRFRP